MALSLQSLHAVLPVVSNVVRNWEKQVFKGLTRLAWGLSGSVILISTLFPSAGNANIFVEDRRQDFFPVPNHLQPIGVLRSLPDDGNWGTAFLVSECHILTAFHVAFPGHQKPRFQPSSSTKSRFFVGRNGEAGGVSGKSPHGFLSSSVATPVSWGKYSSRDYRGLLGDWAILELDDCLGRNYGTLNLTASLQSHTVRGTEVSFAAFPRDRTDLVGIALEERCFIKDWGPGTLIGTDCGVRQGSSGGPLLERIEVADGLGGVTAGYVVVGIAIREMRPRDGIVAEYHPKFRNIALLSEAFDSELRIVLNRLKRN
jgi:hypothetical protein